MGTCTRACLSGVLVAMLAVAACTRPASENEGMTAPAATPTAPTLRGENGGSVSVVDTASRKVTATIQLTGQNVRPMGAVVSADGQRLFVTTGRGGTLVAIDTRTNTPVGSVDVGARPWDRDAVDRRLVEEARTGGGKIIDSENEVGGYAVLGAR